MKRFYKKNFIGNYLLFFFVFLFSFYFAFAENSKESVKQKLTLEERFNFQKAIEEIYWKHRIWPKENPNPKPSLESIISDEAIKTKVENYLQKSNALAYYWKRPIRGEQLQAEMERMARNTKQPFILEEIFNALGNDPYLIAECLARPILVDRLIRNWYAYDERFHKELRKKAESDLENFLEVSEMRLMSGSYIEMEYVLSKEEERQTKRIMDQIILTEEEWIQLKNRLRGDSGNAIGKISKLQEDEYRFYVMAVIKEEADRIRVATVEWRKVSFEEWWKEKEFDYYSFIEPDFSYELPSINFASSTDDTWQSMPSEAPFARDWHTAVWTGAEMIIWGGWDMWCNYLTQLA